MDVQKNKIRRPVALVILDGWGYAPRTEDNAIARAHTPYYDDICRNYPMTTLMTAGVGQPYESASAELGHLTLGTGRFAKTSISQIGSAVASGEFMDNSVLKRAFGKAKTDGSAVHLIGLLSDGGIHSSNEYLFAILRLAKGHGLRDVFIHCILDGVDVEPRTADIYVEALEIKLADIGIGEIATLCGRYFAMDSGERWERTARAFTMLVHAEGERTRDAVTAVRNSFLRGISDEFIAPIIIEKSSDVPVAKVRNGDLVVFFNHRGETMRQLVRSLCLPEGASGVKPVVETVCLTEYDAAFNLPVAFRVAPETNTLTSVLTNHAIPAFKITETARADHLTSFFDGRSDSPGLAEEHIILPSVRSETEPESQSFKITDRFRRGAGASPEGVFIVNMPAADLMADTGDIDKTVAAIQYIDTCIGGIREKVQQLGGVLVLTSSHGNCEELVQSRGVKADQVRVVHPVPLHYVDHMATGVRLSEGGTLADVAPTILAILELEKPAEMTGADLRIL